MLVCKYKLFAFLMLISDFFFHGFAVVVFDESVVQLLNEFHGRSHIFGDLLVSKRYHIRSNSFQIKVAEKTPHKKREEADQG